MGTSEPCTWRLLYKDPRGSVIPPIFECDNSVSANNSTDITKQLIMPFVNRPIFKAKDYLAIAVKARAATADGLQMTKSTVQLPVTIRNIRTGVISRTYLNANDFTEYVSFVSTIQDQWVDWAYYQIPDGTELKVGHRYAFNSRVYVDVCDDT